MGLDHESSPDIKSKGKKVRNDEAFSRSIIEHRNRVSAAKPMSEPADVPYKDALLPLSPSKKIPTRVYRPYSLRDKNTLLPTIFYVPGTAFVASEIAFTNIICSHLAKKSGCQLIVINHSLAPENQFPYGLYEAYATLKFLLSSPSSLYHIDKQKNILVGYSSGGNIAASMALKASLDNLPLSRQMLISPIVDLSRSLRAFRDDFEEMDTTITESFVEWFLELYVPSGINKQNKWLSPFFQTDNTCRKLPPTDIVFAEFDRFRSDAEAYYSKLSTCGVPVSEFMINNEDHSFLWYKLEIVKTLGNRINYVFNESISASLRNSNMMIFINPNKSEISEDLENAELQVVEQKIRSKL
tara:strand:+ start:58 stop:1122 length:1065 start_codon:yes stop_codon:yes gene_type:complete